MLTESNYSVRQLQSDTTNSVVTKSSKSDKSASLKASKDSADSESPSLKSSKKSKSSNTTSKSNKSDKSLSVKASKASKSMDNKSDKSASNKSSKSSKSAKEDTITLFNSKSAKQFDGLQGKSFKADPPFANAKSNDHQHHTVTKSFSQMSGTVNSNSSLTKQGHDAEGVKELDPLIKEPSKPSLISSTPVQLGLAVAILAISLMIHFVRMKRSKTKHSNVEGGAYKPVATGGEAEMTKMGSDDLDAEYGMNDDGDDDGLGMPAQ